MATTADELLTALRYYAKGAIKGNTVDTLGAPVDLINELVLRPILKEKTSSKPVGGSKQLRELFGLAADDANVAETIGSMLSAGGATKAMIVGAAAAGKNVERAEKLLKAKMSPATVFQETGVYKDGGKYKTVVSDEKATFDQDKWDMSSRRKAFPLDEILTHDALFAVYPELKNVPVYKMERQGIAGIYHAQDSAIGLDRNTPDGLVTLLHEVQHAIQQKEKFKSRGTSPDMLRSKDSSLTFEQAQKLYEQNPGEREAVFTQTARNMSPQRLELEVLDLLRAEATPSNPAELVRWYMGR